MGDTYSRLTTIIGSRSGSRCYYLMLVVVSLRFEKKKMKFEELAENAKPQAR